MVMISEPMTMLTDYVLAAAAVVFALRLGPLVSRPNPRSIVLWRWAFSATAVAAIAGGTFHGFRRFLGEGTLELLWGVTTVGIVAGAVLVLGAVFSGPLDRAHPNAPWLIAGGVLTFLGLGVQQSGWSIHAYFNFNDLYHCLQTLALYAFFRGALASASP